MGFLLNGKPLAIDSAFQTDDGTQYPSNFLRLSTDAEKNAIGITWQADPVMADSRFYWDGDINNPKLLDDREEVDENGQPMYVKVLDNSDPANPMMVDSDKRLVTKGLKSNTIAQIKQTAGSLLAQTDWMVVRAAEGIKPAPADVLAKREAIRAASNANEAAVLACTTVAELAALQMTWPAE